MPVIGNTLMTVSQGVACAVTIHHGPLSSNFVGTALAGVSPAEELSLATQGTQGMFLLVATGGQLS